MSTTLTTFHSHAASIADDHSSLTAFAFSIPGEKLLLCCKGEVSVELTEAEQNTQRSCDAWQMLLLARGMLNPAATIVAEWIHFQWRANNQTQDIQLSEVPTPLIEDKTNQQDETKNQD